MALKDTYTTVETPKSADTGVPVLDATEDTFSFLSLYRYATFGDAALMVTGILFSMINGAVFPFLAVLFGNVINDFTPFNQHAINKTVTDFGILAAVLFISGFGSYTAFAISAERQMRALRREVLKHIMFQEIAWYDQRDASELASRISGDTVKIKDGMGEKLGESLRFVCQFFAGYIIGFYKGWNIALAMCAIMPVMAAVMSVLIKRLRSSAARNQQVYAAAGAVAEETIGAMRTVASLNREPRAIQKYSENVLLVERENVGLAKFAAFATGWIFSFIWLAYAIGLWYGGYLVKVQNDVVNTPGAVFSAFYGILMGTIAIAQISPNLSAVAAAKGAATELFKILARPSKIDAANLDGIKPDDCLGHIEAKNLVFSYPARPDDVVLRGYSLTIEQGQTVALVGSSGSGKSTLVALLERFYEPTSGQIFLDGRDIATLQLKWLRSQIGLVSQEPVLFATTILENIAAGGDNISKDEVIAAAKLANAHDFIMTLPNQYDTMCGEKGTTLSGGQKQRVAIARALVRKPKILVLDEATSALDNESERVVQAALNDLMEKTNMTTIVIAHRLSTIRKADKIIVLSKGQVIETGTHSQLMEIDDGLYRALVEVQEGNATGATDTTYAQVSDKPEKAALIRKYSSVSCTIVDFAPQQEAIAAPVDVSIGRIMELTKPERSYLAAGIFACALQGFSMPGAALVVTSILTSMQEHYNEYVTTKKQLHLDRIYSDVRDRAFIFMGGAVAMFFVAFAQNYTFRIMAEKLTTRLRNMHFQALMRQDIGFFDMDGHSTGALTTDLSTYATKVVTIAGENQGRIIQLIFNFLAALIISFGFGSWQLTLVMLCIFPFLLAGSIARGRQMNGHTVSDSLTQSGSLATEAIVNARTVAAFGLQANLASKYDKLLEIPLKNGVRESRINGIMNGFSTGAMFASYAVVFWYGAKLIHDGTISFPEMMRTLMAVMMAAQGMGQAASFLSDTDAARKAAKEIFAVVDRKPIIDSSKVNEGVVPNSVEGRIVFNDVAFAYPTRPDIQILKHYDLTIEPGQTVAFCGPSGGGKSTCIALLERFYQQQSGSITLDGRELSSLNLTWLRNQIGLVGQEPVLFVGTIAENIAGGIANANSIIDLQARVEEAAKMANAHNFISQFPDGYNTQVGLKGEQLSGGQKQRIAIARAIMKNPSILLLDEATSALDSESEKVVQEALDKLLAAKGRTTIVIAHRLSTIRNADKICVVSGGRIAEQGTHDELMCLNGIYTQLASASQP
ncbi:ATP-binding Cassette (ABC) Superfamily [Achlya hypogyna]|uniref:ATP-binding Cassette (ABC) Superfamily n=1 Tax=Achlya hypogyna TaxID=1202772 RepID=A0A1V9YK81_ACHHY|nr:ATP-binding Cassette (ABC) Superfamily [Achlya hypogyna]